MLALSADVEVKGPEGQFSVYVAIPRNHNGVAVIVLQEIFGVNANIRSITDGFATAGYVAVAPDLYWRQAPAIQLDAAIEADRERAMELMQTLDRDQAVADGAAALRALGERVPGLKRSAAVGYCFGGGVAFLMAARGLVDAGVAYYGTGLHTILGELEELKSQLLIHVAGDDYLCPREAQLAIAEAASKAGGKATVIVHPGVGHAFARAGGATYNKEAAASANFATLNLLETLASGS